MVNAKDFFSGNFLKAEDCKGGELCEILDAGSMEEITSPEGKVKPVLNFDIRFDLEGAKSEKTFTPNKSNGNVMVEAWGDDTDKWVGKRFKIALGKVNVFGKFKNSIIVEPLDVVETQKVQTMAKVIEVIETYEKRGLGKEGDPVRQVYQLWTKDGILIFEKEPLEEVQRMEIIEGYRNTGKKWIKLKPIEMWFYKILLFFKKTPKRKQTMVKKEKADKIVKFKMPKEQAKEEWKKYCEVLKKRKEKFLQVMKDAMYQMKEGRELIDVYELMKKFGLSEKNEPVFAIARADLKEVLFEKRDESSGRFGVEKAWNSEVSWTKDNVTLPEKTFDIHWERDEEFSHQIKDKLIKTKVPIIPIELLPDGDLSNYYILWEAVEWESLPPPKDPILLKRLSENLFVILGSWDVTELERSVMRGLTDQKMPKRPKFIEKKEVKDFDVKDWENAYAQLNVNLDKLKNKMRKAMNCISQAQNYLSEAVL